MRKITEKRPRLQPIDLSKLKTYPLGRRHSKVQVSDFSVAWRHGGSLRLFLQTLPDILAVKTLRAQVELYTAQHGDVRPDLLANQWGQLLFTTNAAGTR